MGNWPVCLSDQQVSACGSPHFAGATSGSLRSLEWPAGLCLQSKITDFILSIQIPCGCMNILFALRIFLFIAGYWNLHTSFFFSRYLLILSRLEISVTLSIGNKLYSRHHILYFAFLWKQPCWCYLATALNLLSSSLPAKLEYSSRVWSKLYKLSKLSHEHFPDMKPPSKIFFSII